MNDTCKWKFLVIDDAYLLEINNLKRTVNQAAKHGQPVITMDAPWDQDNEMFNGMNVMYDEEEGIFKMWYGVMRYEGQLSDGSRKLAYATSTDGIHWDRPKLGLVEVNGSKDNNYVIPEMGSFACSIIKDPSDVPERQYKMIFAILGRETTWAGFHSPLSLAYSHDGIHWERPVHVNPVIRGISDDCFSLLYDPDRRKYILLTRRVPNLPRDISQYESYDLVNWEDKGRVLVPGDEHDPPEMYNFYYMSPFRYANFYLAMVNTMYSHPISETYESFHKSPNYPKDRLGHLDIQLAYSTDARTWRRPADRTPVVPNGEYGTVDHEAIYPAQNPIVIDGETWIYYSATSHLHSWWHVLEQYDRDGSVRNVCCGMLAKMPEDHWVSLDAGPSEGSVLTKPMFVYPELLINADASAGRIEAELLTPYGQPVEGFARKDCIPITSDGKDQTVKWKSGSCTRDLAKEHRGGLCARFYLKNAKLYSFGFAEPDPDGTLRRYQANMRWFEIIKHKSDNWDRLSTEPAIGLPPHSGPGPEKGQEKPGQPTWDN